MRSPLSDELDAGWSDLLADLYQADYFAKILAHLEEEKASGQVVYPEEALIFNAFRRCPLKKLKVLLLGQDPYHNEGQAMGLSFSVPQGLKVPPSLKNIYEELSTDLGYPIPDHGDLSKWADQGVLLLNAMLTVRSSTPGSHKKIGWQKFTDAIIASLSTNHTGLVFLLWGNFAKSKAALIDQSKHLILEAAHPSPLARGAFFNSKPFSKTNNYLIQTGQKPIDWQIQ